MKTDRELLELAAKAAGINIYESTDGTIQARPVWVFLGGGGMGTMPYEVRWNPLGDDAQALRLAVKLKLFLDLESCNAADTATPDTTWFGGGENEFAGVSHDECDPYAATRRAIVRAAAAIGEAMQ